MPRDNDKNSGPSRGRRDRPGGKGPSGGKGASGGKGRSGAARGPEKKFAKRGFAGKSEGGGSDERKPFVKKPYAGAGKPYAAKPYAGKRDGERAPRRDDGDAPRPARFNRDDRP